VAPPRARAVGEAGWGGAVCGDGGGDTVVGVGSHTEGRRWEEEGHTTAGGTSCTLGGSFFKTPNQKCVRWLRVRMTLF
jgi:hypothetical protein